MIKALLFKGKGKFLNAKLIIVLLNIIILLLNILLFIKSIGDNYYVSLNFKNADNFTFFLSKNIYKKNYKDNIMNKNQTIKVSFNCVDTLNTQISNDLIKYWFHNQKNFLFEVNKEDPDFLIYDIVGRENLNSKFNNSLKIAYYTKNAIPDLNLANYALGQAHIMYLDRYLKIPYFIFVLEKVGNYNLNQIRREAINNKRKNFCAAVISNNLGFTYFRMNFINELS